MTVVLDLILIIGASLRLSRLVTTDSISEPFRSAAFRWAGENPRRLFWAESLECPFCIGFWLGVLVVVSYVLTGGLLWKVIAGALALNYLTGHISSRLDYASEEDE